MAYVGCALGIDAKRRDRHRWDMSLLTFLETAELENIASVIYCIVIMFAKLSIPLLYVNIFLPTGRGGVFWANQVLIYG